MPASYDAGRFKDEVFLTASDARQYDYSTTEAQCRQWAADNQVPYHNVGMCKPDYEGCRAYYVPNYVEGKNQTQSCGSITRDTNTRTTSCPSVEILSL